MASFAEAWRSFWHTMTSNDRHASHNSPYRTGSHVPLPQARQTNLTSVATDASESRTNLASPYAADDRVDAAPPFASPSGIQSPASPYSPGMRSALQRTRSAEAGAATLKSPMKSPSTQEIPMQSFDDGLPPPPPISHSWRRIDHWLEDNYTELWDNLGEGNTQNDINELEHSLDSTLPQDVRDSWQIHDGQEGGGRPTGVIFSAMLLDCEEIIREWHNWQAVNEEYLSKRPSTDTSPPPKPADGGQSSSSNPPRSSTPTQSNWRDQLLAKQASQPPNAIQKAYFHPGWIPIVRDWGGNNLCVDLAPGPAGKWGQIILMGRDYDCKYVVARSWGHLLAMVADDMSTSKVYVDEETNDLKLNEFKNAQPAYLDILRWRTDQKYGRRPMPRRRSTGPGSVGRGSPYGSPRGSVDGERGQSPSRFPSRSLHNSSPRASGQISSPLARVAEEGPASISSQVNGSPRKEAFPRAEKLVSVSTDNTPRQSVDSNAGLVNGGVSSPLRTTSSSGDGNKENVKSNGTAPPSGLGVKNLETVGHGKKESQDMKTVEL